MEDEFENQNIIIDIRDGNLEDIQFILESDEEDFDILKWMTHPAGQTGCNRFTYAAAVNWNVFEYFVRLGVPMDLIDPINKTALCYCNTSEKVVYAIQNGANPYQQLATEQEGKWMYPVHYMLQLTEYTAALACFQMMEHGLPVVCDASYGFFSTITEKPGAVALVRQLCDMKCYDDHIPFLHHGMPVPNCGATLLSRMCLSTTPVAVRIVDCLCEHHVYPGRLGADMLVALEPDENGKISLESVFEHTLRNGKFIHLRSLTLASKDYSRVTGLDMKLICGQLESSDIDNIGIEDFFGLAKTLSIPANNFNPNMTYMEMLRFLVKISVEILQNEKSAMAVLRKMASVAKIYDIKTLSLVYRPADWPVLTNFAFKSGKDKFLDFISEYGELNFSNIQWAECIADKEGIGLERIEKALELNQQFSLFSDKQHRTFNRLGSSNVQFLIFSRHGDLIRLLIMYDMLTPFEKHENEEDGFYLTTSSLGNTITIAEDDDEEYDKQKHEALLTEAYNISNEIRTKLAYVKVAEGLFTNPSSGTYDPYILGIVSQYILKK